MKIPFRKLILTLAFGSAMVFSQLVFAQDAAGAAPVAETTFMDVIYGDSILNLLIWLMLFATSIAGIGFIIDGIITIRTEKIMPRTLSDEVRAALEQGDLGAALDACDSTPSPLANILSAGLNNVENGYSVVVDSISSAAEIETEKMMQRVNMLNLVAAIAPMLGLMGTVIGMVMAFASLAKLEGNAKATALSLNISIALYTTLYGLLVAVPVLVAYTFIKNQANKLILTMEMLTYDLIKVLKDAEVVDNG